MLRPPLLLLLCIGMHIQALLVLEEYILLLCYLAMFCLLSQPHDGVLSVLRGESGSVLMLACMCNLG